MQGLYVVLLDDSEVRIGEGGGGFCFSVHDELGTRQMRSELVVGYERPRIVMGMRAFCEINRMQECNGEDE